MLAFLLFLILLWVALGIIGFVVKSIFYLFVIACVAFVLTLAFAGFRATRRKSINR